MYGMIFRLPKQYEQIEKHCFGDCGKIIIGSVIDNELGELVMCNQDDCPCLDRQMEEPIGEVDGIKIYLRKLLEGK